MDTFGVRLRYLRKAKGLSQKELAKLLNLESSSTISQYETLNRIPDAHILQNIADIFTCSLDYLLARTDVVKVLLIFLELWWPPGRLISMYPGVT